jgi:hypothetical protein
MTQTQDSDAQRAGSGQEKPQQVKTTVEFFREKYADEESEPVWIDPKGDPEDLPIHRFGAGKTGVGKSVRHTGLLDDEYADGEREADL